MKKQKITPEERADDLIAKYILTYDGFPIDNLELFAVECAIIAIDEKIETIRDIYNLDDDFNEDDMSNEQEEYLIDLDRTSRELEYLLGNVKVAMGASQIKKMEK